MLRGSLEIFSEGEESLPEAFSLNYFSTNGKRREHVTDRVGNTIKWFLLHSTPCSLCSVLGWASGTDTWMLISIYS